MNASVSLNAGLNANDEAVFTADETASSPMRLLHRPLTSPPPRPTPSTSPPPHPTPPYNNAAARYTTPALWQSPPAPALPRARPHLTRAARENYESPPAPNETHSGQRWRVLLPRVRATPRRFRVHGANAPKRARCLALIPLD